MATKKQLEKRIIDLKVSAFRNSQLKLGHELLLYDALLQNLNLLDEFILQDASKVDPAKKDYFKKRKEVVTRFLEKVRILMLPLDESEQELGALIIADNTVGSSGGGLATESNSPSEPVS